MNLFQIAENWQGVKFRYQGFSRNGCDCIGLIIGVIIELNSKNEKILDNLKNVHCGTNIAMLKDKIEDILLESGYFEKIDKIEDDSILYFSNHKSMIIHFGIYFQKKIIHTSQEIGKVVILEFSEEMQKDIKGIFRLKSQFY